MINIQSPDDDIHFVANSVLRSMSASEQLVFLDCIYHSREYTRLQIESYNLNPLVEFIHYCKYQYRYGTTWRSSQFCDEPRMSLFFNGETLIDAIYSDHVYLLKMMEKNWPLSDWSDSYNDDLETVCIDLHIDVMIGIYNNWPLENINSTHPFIRLMAYVYHDWPDIAYTDINTDVCMKAYIANNWPHHAFNHGSEKIRTVAHLYHNWDYFDVNTETSEILLNEYEKVKPLKQMLKSMPLHDAISALSMIYNMKKIS